jgi:hypothetical protein
MRGYDLDLVTSKPWRGQHALLWLQTLVDRVKMLLLGVAHCHGDLRNESFFMIFILSIYFEHLNDGHCCVKVH